ncbi:hypothetical protein SRABI133_03458 [Peribacillus simplex]|uniref:Uncharacterized protein n=1 Tax=Peribacillus simplex TaxID=1478 RepID=A0A9W4PGJ1_9BACI|nr:hypothetical protein SRABI133_03458 [Peribacillus simplex]
MKQILQHSLVSEARVIRIILRYERIRISRGGSIAYIKNQGFTNSWEVEGIANSSIFSLAR